MVIIAVIAALVLAFANGANDNSKGVATLIGAGALSARRSLYYAAVATFLGSASAMLLAGGLVAKFSGKGLVDDSLIAGSGFLACVGMAAGATVLLASRIGMPISTTHALVGGIVGVGLSADALHGTAVLNAFVKPLLMSPAIALVLAASVYPLFRWTRLRLGVTQNTCVCIAEEYHPVSMASDGALVLRATGLKLTGDQDVSACVLRYDGHVVGVDAQRLLNGAHFFTAGAISFARGLNDTPKMAAILIVAGAFSPGPSIIALGVAIALGGLLAVRRVAQTMSHRITGMNDGQAFTANLVTAGLVIVASRLGMPVSTTHVSCGSLFGIGLVNRHANLKVIGQILLAWLTTLPLAAAMGWIAWRLLGG